MSTIQSMNYFDKFEEGQMVYYKPNEEDEHGAIFEIIDKSIDFGMHCITIGKENGQLSTLIDVYKLENLISVDNLRNQITENLRSLHNKNPNDGYNKLFEKACLCGDYDLRDFFPYL